MTGKFGVIQAFDTATRQTLSNAPKREIPVEAESQSLSDLLWTRIIPSFSTYDFDHSRQSQAIAAPS